MNQNDKKTPDNRFIYIKLIFSSIILLIIIFSFIFGFQLKDISNKILNQAITSKMAFNLYQKSIGEGQISNNINIQKHIDQYNSLDEQTKHLALLLLTSEVRISLLKPQHIDNSILQFSSLLKNEKSYNKYKEKIQITSEPDIEIYKTYLSQLIVYYNELESNKNLGNTISAKIIAKFLQEPGTIFNSKILLSLYALNSNIENWKKIKEFTDLEFDPHQFVTNKQEYWNKNFAAQYGDKIPEYLEIIYSNDMDINIAKNWINHYKL